MYSVNVDKIGNSDITARQELFPVARTTFEAQGSRTIVRCEEQYGEPASVYESPDNLATILATHPRGKQHITVTVVTQNHNPLSDGPKTMAFPVDRCRVIPESSGSIVRVISPVDNHTIVYGSTDTPTAILGTL